jgi:hypothetical protein
MSHGAGAPKHAIRCAWCGREVAETMHTRAAYTVGFYSLHTGDVEPVTLQRADEGLPPVTVLRLIRPYDVHTCADCYRDPAVRAARDARFRPEERTADEEPAS